MKTNITLKFDVVDQKRDIEKTISKSFDIDLSLFSSYSQYLEFIDSFQEIVEIELLGNGFKTLCVTEEFNNDVHTQLYSKEV